MPILFLAAATLSPLIFVQGRWSARTHDVGAMRGMTRLSNHPMAPNFDATLHWDARFEVYPDLGTDTGSDLLAAGGMAAASGGCLGML